MSTTTVNAFPPLHAFNSSRSWFLAVIVLVHLGFFWALTNGLVVYIDGPRPPKDVVLLPSEPVKPLPQKQIEVEPVLSRIFIPTPEVPNLPHTEETNAPIQVTREAPPPPVTVTEGPGSGPLIVEPASDPRYPFSVPDYPVSEIRLGHEGTVWLKVQILPTGRVGAVQIDQSSGFVKLDEAAAREARRYRMKPGTHDGVATAMWVKVPVTFQLKDRN